jgi:serine/threonine protein kinase
LHKYHIKRNFVINKYIIVFPDNEYNNDSDYLLILEYADGGTLRNYLKENFNKLNLNNKLQFAMQISDAVSYLHQKSIIHCGLVSILF